MGAFTRALAAHEGDPRDRRWVFVTYDQLSAEIGPLARVPARHAGLVVVESPEKAARRPYHKQKLALVLANLRHFALEQAARGVAIRHVVGPYAKAIASAARELGPLEVMRPAEREMREELAPLLRDGLLREVPHDGWLTTKEDFEASQSGPPWRMDAFYRYARRATGILMSHGKPVGGRFSFDTENREPWRGEPPAASPPTFRSDPIKDEVLALVRERFSEHPGALRPEALPATHADAEALWRWAKRACLPLFGPYEDAMSTASTNLFHTRLSMLLNNHRLLPARVVKEAAAMDAPIPSREGFVRQILGWRELVRHVHEATDGFRARVPVDFLGASEPLPDAFWDWGGGARKSGLACLDEVVRSVWDEGYSHHITRLMVLSNIAQLLDVSPRELSDWFWVAYVDAYDWVVEPNVLGMGTFSAGDAMTTKPYVAGSGYIAKMSDYCTGCRFDPKTTCPLGPLYWAYLARHEDALLPLPRMKLPLASLRKRTDAQRRADRATFERVRRALAAREELE